MKTKQIAIVVSLVIVGIAFGMSANRLFSEGRTYTLYRDSPIGKDMRLHVATFDAGETEDYNRDNCILTGKLFQSQPGVTARYWCEKGYFKQ